MSSDERFGRRPASVQPAPNLSACTCSVYVVILTNANRILYILVQAGVAVFALVLITGTLMFANIDIDIDTEA
jgi:hypothetical protein